MINVIGLGYIGLPTALMLASHGQTVVGTDYNQEIIDRLNHGETTFRENGLTELYHAARKNGIRFTTEYQKTDVYIVSVPTPYDDATKQENCKNIIEKMHALGKRVVAEGVETKEEFDYLVSIGADLFQGYYLARPA